MDAARRARKVRSALAIRGPAPTLNVAARRIFRRPRLMKTEVAEMTGDVNNLADEIKPRHGPRSKRLRRTPRYIDAAHRHLRGAVAFGSVRPDAPLLHIGYDTHENKSVMRFVVGHLLECLALLLTMP